MRKRLIKLILWLFSGAGVVAITYIKWDALDYGLILNFSFAILLAGICLAFLSYLVQFSKRKNIHQYIKCKIKELISILSDSSPIKIPSDIKYDCSKLLKYHDNIVDVYRNVVCKNQGLLSEFIYKAGELHKPLKNEIGKTSPQADKLKEFSDKLKMGISDQIYRACDANNELVLMYFKDRSPVDTRFCIKVITEPFIIEDYYRPVSQCDYQSRTYRYDANKGCHWVVSKGTYYLCNDIPSHIYSEDYFNPRIDARQVRERIKQSETFQNHSNWCQCWYPNRGPNGEEVLPETESCYKSTMIVPMTLFRNELSDKFKKHFEIPEQQNKSELARAIYGFTCFDHINTNYFDETLDWKAAYIFSDLISLYIIIGNLYSKYSKTYKKAQKIIKDELSQEIKEEAV